MTDTQAITVRLPRDLYEKLRGRAFETRVSMNELVTEGLSLILKDKRDRSRWTADLIQVVLLSADAAWFKQDLAERGLKLYSIPTVDDLPTYGIRPVVMGP